MSEPIKQCIITNKKQLRVCTIRLKESLSPIWRDDKLTQSYFIWKDSDIIIGTDTDSLTEAIETYNKIVDVYKEMHSNI